MNNAKNFVILLLSILVILQSLILFYLLRRPAPAVRRPSAVTRTAAKPGGKFPAVFPGEVKPLPPAGEEAPVPVPAVGKIALIIDDWGYSLKNKSIITDNNYHLTLAILPFQEYSKKVAELAHFHGKEVIIHMPMEPLHKEQYGLEANTLLTTMNASQIVHILDKAFSEIPYAKGINNHMGSKATGDARMMRIVLGYLKDRDLFFVDSMTAPKSIARSVAKTLHEKFASRDVFLDNSTDPASIREQLMKLAHLARQNGVAVGIGHDRPNTIAVLKEMIPFLQRQGYEFIEVSDAVKNP
ncbi:hypothetical protein BU251_05000 [Candidatus Velamenicoccus archaeovorus]|uniref:Divergent polysaccharide deacetylase family protein n=1 Tax=Velamenicoccus archaeovorus TaxID=1930593 RepID=A0A410P4Y2_VELA1|nr:divergent polysaccharide deacetylase family protein [Candidatus Velamenicoccus archaeovorus]QAT17131.1 hypothetical protein BU251_05000 [Candidatus Velamenicoccus archaeovorus]